MRHRHLWLLGFVGGLLLTGLSACTPTRSYEENKYILDRIAREESKMFVEDMQKFLLIDEPTKLSRWRYP